MTRFVVLILFFYFAVIATATSQDEIDVEIVWSGVEKFSPAPDVTAEALVFKGASYPLKSVFIPHYSTHIPVSKVANSFDVTLHDVVSSPCSNEEVKVILSSGFEIPTQYSTTATALTIAGNVVAEVLLLPIRKIGKGSYEKLVSAKLKVNGSGFGSAKRASRSFFSSQSVLASGNWVKVATGASGVYKITGSLLKSWGAPSDVSPQSIRVYGNRGGMLPEDPAGEFIDDLVQIPVIREDNGDAVFQSNEALFFYADNPSAWSLGGGLLNHKKNLYTDSLFYFVSWDDETAPQLAMPVRASLSSSGAFRVPYAHHADVHEVDAVNVISSGKEWYGEEYGARTSIWYEFLVPNIDKSQDITLSAEVLMRTIQGTSTMEISLSGVGSLSLSESSGVTGDYKDTYGRTLYGEIVGKPTSDRLKISTQFTKGRPTALAYMNRLELNAKKQLVYSGDPSHFWKLEHTDQAELWWVVSGVNANTVVLDVSDAISPVLQQVQRNGNVAEWVHQGTDTVGHFYMFDKTSSPEPVFISRVENQNLHALQNEAIEYLVVAHPDFITEAQSLVALHKEHDGLLGAVVNVEQVYNEFSAGRQDISAIRNFIRMLYENGSSNQPLKYVLMFGDASYDYKDRISGNSNYVPTFESANGIRPTSSYASDDFFGFLVPGSFTSEQAFPLDVAVGRFPVRTRQQAIASVEKVKRYLSTNSLGSWRNRVTYVGDDEDGNLHMSQAFNLSEIIRNKAPEFDVDKVLFDAFPQRSTPGGQRYPDVTTAINDRVSRGVLTINYVGHGGELGWAHERVLEIDHINKWTNSTNMPLFVTATCEFSRFDDPKRTSAGEFVFLNPTGGGIGLLTTTRLVYSGPNYTLASTFNDTAYSVSNGTYPRLGDILVATKSNPQVRAEVVNMRSFALLGDPALRLAYPKYRVYASAQSMPDTIQSLEKVKVSGFVGDINGNIKTDFNGTIYPVVFDKAREVKLLNNDQLSNVNSFDGFTNFENYVYRGQVKATNGKFSYEFVVPKDIRLSYGKGRISYYADNGQIDANGYYEDFVIGGVNPNAADDVEGPQVKAYMNDSSFVNGGITNESPVLKVQLFDENGINTVGNGIGHDIKMILDNNTADAVVLNEFYQSELNSYQRGMIEYPIDELAPGSHTLKVKAWDVYNNSGETEITFIVHKSDELTLSHVLNYPNPFTTNTQFFFEHNFPGQSLEVRLQVFTVAGNLVKTIDGYHTSEGFRVGPIHWDGTDDYGDRLATGVYVYKLKVTAPNNATEEVFEKLVILN